MIRDSLMNGYSNDLDIMISSDCVTEFIELIEEKYGFVDTHMYILTEYPRKGEKLFLLGLFDENLNVGIIELKKSLIEELKFKDFTVNAMSYNIIDQRLENNEFTLKGLKDLRGKILTCVVEEKETFINSPSGVLRLLRLRVTHKFNISSSIKIFFMKQDVYKNGEILANHSFFS